LGDGLRGSYTVAEEVDTEILPLVLLTQKTEISIYYNSNIENHVLNACRQKNRQTDRQTNT